MERLSLCCCRYAATLRNRRKQNCREDVVMSLPVVLQSPQVQYETLKDAFLDSLVVCTFRLHGYLWKWLMSHWWKDWVSHLLDHLDLLPAEWIHERLCAGLYRLSYHPLTHSMMVNLRVAEPQSYCHHLLMLSSSLILSKSTPLSV